jgi:serine/threonine protein kinase
MGLSNFRKLSLLGKGAFGQVYLVENIIDKK